jgi:pilus assembly protein CpaB
VQVVNLLVTPDQAEILALASNETRIQLVLRNPLDTQTTKTSGVAMSGLFGGPIKPPEPVAPRPRKIAERISLPYPVAAPPKAAPPVTVEVMNGNKRVESKFPAAAESVQ